MLDDPIHDANVFGETPARRLESSGAADFLVRGALGERLVLTVETLATRNVVKDHDAIATAVVVDLFTDCGNDAGGFVSKDARGGVGACGNLLEVGAADAAGVDADEHLAGADRGDGDGFEADVVHAAIHGGLHGCWDGLWKALDHGWSGNGHEVILDDVGEEMASGGGAAFGPKVTAWFSEISAPRIYGHVSCAVPVGWHSLAPPQGFAGTSPLFPPQAAALSAQAQTVYVPAAPAAHWARPSAPMETAVVVWF